MAARKKRAWRMIFNPDGDVADVLAYPSALAEGSLAGKYMLSTESLPNTVVIQAVRNKGILAGADVKIAKERAKEQNIDVAVSPRTGRRGARPAGVLQLQELLARASRRFKAVDTDPDDPAVILYTSGTTGLPKGVTLTHRNFHTQYAEIVPKIFPMTKDDVVVGVLPLYHVYGLSNGLVSSMYHGCAFSLIPQYSPHNLLVNIEEVKATILIAIPTMYMHLLALARARKTAMPKTLKQCVSGGAPLPVKTIRDFEMVFGARIAEGYGLTETTSAVCLNKPGEAFKPGSIGQTTQGVGMKVVDGDGKELRAREVGEIIIKSPVVTPGYWNDPAATAESLRDGWLYTGDLGFVDEDGFFFITDRKKDIIIHGGFNISPREVEEVIFTHPKIADVAVIGVPDRRSEEYIKAFAVLRTGETAGEKEIIEHCREHLASYKVPKAVEFLDSLPKSATGKILRKELRADFEDVRLITREDGHE